MKLAITSDFKYQFLFFLAVVFSYVNNYELTLFVWLCVLFLTLKRYYSVDILKLIIPFFVIAIIAGIRSFFYKYDTYTIVRDIAYFIKPIVGLLIGYQCVSSKKNNFLNVVVYISLIFAIVHLLMVAYAFAFESIRNIHRIRLHAGYFSDFETFAFIIIIFKHKFNLNYSKKFYLFLLITIGTSVVFYFARTNLIQFFILFFGMFGLYKFSKEKLIILCALFILGFLGYQKIVEMNPIRNAKGIEGFLYKVKNAPKEIYDPYIVNDNSSRFHDNFRSYETKVTILQMLNDSNSALYFGKGLGSTVDYGRYMGTNDGTMVKHAPILHNGYTTVFLKAGLLGLFIYLIMMFNLYHLGARKKFANQENIKLLLSSTAVFMFISSLVFLGFYLKLDNKSLFVGGLIAYLELKGR